MTPPVSAESRPDAQLLEREGPRDRLRDAASAASAGQGSMLVVVGSPGEGKSAMLADASRIGEALGLRVWRAWGSTLERPFGFGVVRQLLVSAVAASDPSERERLLSGAARHAAGVLDLDDRSQPLDPAAASQGLYWLLVGLAGREATLLLVDDAHWADPQSLAWLAALAPRLAELPVLVVAATRPAAFEEGGDQLSNLLAEQAVTTLHLGPLERESVAALIDRELGAEPDQQFVTACHAATGGNPLAVIEVLRQLRQDRALPDSEHAKTLGDRAPETIQHHVHRRLSGLGSDAVRIARALAILGDRSRLEHVLSLALVEPGASRPALQALERAGIIAPDPELRFEHPLVHAAVRDGISVPLQAHLHAQAAGVLLEQSGDPEAIAAHLLLAQPASDPGSVGALRAAAMAALRRGSPEGALAYLERALAEPPPPEQRAAVLAELGLAAWTALATPATGRIEAARELAADRGERARLDLMLAELCYYSGQRDRVFATLDRALAELDGSDPELELELRAMRTTALAGLDAGWPAADDAEHEALVAAAGPDSRLGRELRLSLALTGICSARLTAPETIATVERVGIEELLGLDQAGSISRVAHGLFALVLAGAFERAAELAERMMADAAARGIVGKLGLGAHVHAFAQLGRGALADAEASGRLAFGLSVQAEARFAEPLVRATLGAVLLERGQLDEARELLTAIVPDPAIPATGCYLRPPLTTLYRAEGDRAAALEQLTALRAELRADEWPNPAFMPLRSQLALLTVADDPERAWELAEAEVTDARRLRLPRAIGVALRARAAAEPDAVAEATLRESVATLEGDASRLELARSLIALGAHLRRSGRRRAAREPLRRALELAHQCAADPLIASATEELHAADARPRSPWLSGAASLTASELRVARLAASGASNQQIAETLFVTLKTVEMHLTSAYRKLGTHSRSELPALLKGEPVTTAGQAADPDPTGV